MSDNRSNKKYSKMKDSKRPLILAKRETSVKNDRQSNRSSADDQIQPKILLKSKEKDSPLSQPSIVIRESTINEVASSSQSPNNISVQIKEKETNQIEQQPITPIPIMTRPIVLISSINYQVNSIAMKTLMKTNTDFFVVGILGTQAVGKSTIMNLLATDNFHTYKNMINDKNDIFPVKFKPGKCSSMPRTDSVNMFITKDRMILLDCPPVLSNPYRRDEITSELDDIKLIITMLSVCHLVIIVQDDYFNLNLIRLLQFAELTKSVQDSMKSFVSDYVPNILFVKNKANRLDFITENKLNMKQMLEHFFKYSKLKIHYGQNVDKHNIKQTKQSETENYVNYFVFPQIQEDSFEPEAYYPSLEVLFTEIRNHVFMSERREMYNGSSELTESLWFDLLTATMQNKNNFFLNTYEEVRRSHRDTKLDSTVDDI